MRAFRVSLIPSPEAHPTTVSPVLDLLAPDFRPFCLSSAFAFSFRRVQSIAVWPLRPRSAVLTQR